MKKTLLAMAFLVGTAAFAGPRISIGVRIGSPYGYYPAPLPPSAYYYEAEPVYAVPPCPGPGYSWIDGYWYFSGPRRLWRQGYWSAPVYAPRYYDRGYYGRGYDRGYRGHERYERNYRGGYRR